MASMYDSMVLLMLKGERIAITPADCASLLTTAHRAVKKEHEQLTAAGWPSKRRVVKKGFIDGKLQVWIEMPKAPAFEIIGDTFTGTLGVESSDGN